MTRYAPAILVVFLISTLSNISVMAAGVGVKPGHWAKYTATSVESGVSSVTLSILSVSGTRIYGNITYEYPQGQGSQTTSFQYDISTGGTPAFFIPANLQVGDAVASGAGVPRIAGVETRTYAGASRTVVYATVASIERYYYWDQQTGILVEMSPGGAYSLKLTETNIWSGGIFDTSNPFLWVVITVIIVIAVALALVVLSSLRKKKPVTETVTPPSPPAEKSAKTKYCPKCGTSMPWDSIYCPKCGHKQP